MTLLQSLINLGNAVRKASWKDDKMTINEMAKALNGSRSAVNIVAPMPQLQDEQGFTSNANSDGSQTFLKSSGQFNGEQFYPVKGVKVQLKAGDIIREEVTVNAQGFYDLTANFRGERSGYHPMLANDKIQISDKTVCLRYVYTVQDDDTYYLLDFWSEYSGPDDVTFYNPYVAITTSGGVTRNILSGAPLNPDFFTGNKAVKLQNTTVYYEIHNGIHAMYNIDPIYAGKRFKITYWAKSDTPNAKIHFEPWGSDGAVDHQLTTEWQNFSDYAVLSTTAQQIYFWSKGDYTVELTDIIITIEK